MNSGYINSLIEQEIVYSDSLASKYNYPDNVTHLLYLIIPAFIIKYGTNYRTLIEQCFMDVPIFIDDKQDKVFQAYYYSHPFFDSGSIKTKKQIVLQNYNNISLMQLIDNLVHEYNHAVNSLQNEIEIKDYVSVRTGISFNYFNKKNLTFIKKSDDIILEEVLNTRQTEKIVNIIKSLNDYEINNSTITSTLYSINHSVLDGYKSDSYYIESFVCDKLMENKTFISTFETLRFDGQVDDLHNFFDEVTGIKGSLHKLSVLLNKSLNLQHEYAKAKFFKKAKLNKIREITHNALEIVELFNRNTVYK